jgi:hypothetical protein
MITTNFLFVFYVKSVILIDLAKTIEYSGLSTVQIGYLAIKILMLLFHILMNILFCFSLDYFMKCIKYQALFVMILFSLVTNLQFVYTDEDIIVTLSGLYFFLPIMLINLNEKW